MTARATVSRWAALVESKRDRFDYVRRIELERALFAIAKDLASTEVGIVISGFSDEVLQDLLAQAADRPRTIRIIKVLMRVLEKIRLISSGDPYITLEGEDVTLEGRREIVTSLGGDLRTLLNELDSFV